MAVKDYQEVSFFGKRVFVDTSFKTHFDQDQKTLMVVEKHYTDFNAVLVYQEEDQSIRLYPRWQTTFLFKEDCLYIDREG